MEGGSGGLDDVGDFAEESPEYTTELESVAVRLIRESVWDADRARGTDPDVSLSDIPSHLWERQRVGSLLRRTEGRAESNSVR